MARARARSAIEATARTMAHVGKPSAFIAACTDGRARDAGLVRAEVLHARDVDAGMGPST
jgi:hypothetical protein